MTYDACVIGAGASGLVCASELSKRGFTTLLIEQNKKSGRKLYATGNGRCNIANAVLSSGAYYEDSFASNVVNEGSVTLLKRYLASVGIPLTEKGGYYYPVSMQASSVVWALTDACRLSGAKIRYDSRVRGIERGTNGRFILEIEEDKTKEKKLRVECNRLVLSMGSPAAGELGAADAGDIYHLLEDVGLPYLPFEPALCPVEVEEDLSSLSGVRVKAGIRMGIAMDKPELASAIGETGELQITDYGLSGIVVFNLSGLIQTGEQVSVDLLPGWQDPASVLYFLRGQDGERTLYGALNGLLHEKLCHYFILQFFGEERLKKKLFRFTDDELLDFINILKDWRLTVTGKRGEMSQACRGGVQTHILNPNTMQVLRDPRLAVTGELCNVTGRCGGYNLMFALISGMRAGQRV